MRRQTAVVGLILGACLCGTPPASARPAHDAGSPAALAAAITPDIQNVCAQFNGTMDCSGPVNETVASTIIMALEKLEFDWLRFRLSLSPAPAADDPVAQDGVLSWSGLMLAQMSKPNPDVGPAWANAPILYQNVTDFMKLATISHGKIVWQGGAPPLFKTHGLVATTYLTTQTPPRP